jgi:N-acetylmuramate 1-kinase
VSVGAATVARVTVAAMGTMPTSSSPRDRQLGAWLDAILGSQWVARPLAGDASFRRYLRVTGAGDRRWVVMDAPPEKEDVGPFEEVATLLARAGIRVPSIEAKDRAAGFLLLSDLGDELYLGRLRSDNADALYEGALATLVSMQRWVPTRSLPVYDSRLLRDEMMLFPVWFLRTHLRYTPSARQGRALEEAFAVLEASALEQPRYFVHRDYHSRNLLVCDGAVGVLDFQDAVSGPITYDLVSLLRDVYIEWPAARVDGWIERYRTLAIEARLLPVSEARRLRRWFDLMGVQRHLKVAGIFARLCHRDGKTAYLRSLPVTLRYLTAEIAPYPELGSLRALLRDVLARFSAEELIAGRDRR